MLRRKNIINRPRRETPLMESPENSACKCARSLLSSPFPAFTLPPNEAAFCSCGAQHRTVLGKREISPLAENAYTSAGASGTFIIVNEYFTSVTLTSEPWRGESPRASRYDGEIATCDRIQHSFFLGKKIGVDLWLINRYKINLSYWYAIEKKEKSKSH